LLHSNAGQVRIGSADEFLMSASQFLLFLLGQIALLLWGIRMIESSVQRAFGSELRLLLSRGLSSRGTAFLAGLGVTTLLQSSTATGLMAASLTASGTLALLPALAIMLGANVGSTLIVQLVSLKIGLLYPALVFAGLLTFRLGGRSRTREIGRILIGLGLVLLAIELLVATMEPLEHAPAMRELMGAITRDPFFNLLIAAVLTWAAHSSVAVVMFVMSLAGAGAITPEAAIAMVLGANLGSALNPVLESRGRDRATLRLPIGNLLTRLVGCLAVLPLIGWVAASLALLEPDPARIAANFHTIFNLAVAALFIGLLSLVARLLVRLLPPTMQAADPGTPQYLDRTALDVPQVALSNASREVLRMSDVVESMLRGAQDLLHTDDSERLAELRRMDDILDRLNGAVGSYLAAIGQDYLDEAAQRRLSEVLDFAINLEHVGDIIDKTLLPMHAKRIRLQLSFSQEGLRELDDMYRRLLEQLHLAVAVFMAQDMPSARRLVEEKDRFRELERAATRRHFQRVREGRSESVETSSLHLDIVRDLKRIESHIAATAYPLLEQAGHLQRSRLTESGEPA
jgi:phosphate:Na+ symporter